MSEDFSVTGWAKEGADGMATKVKESAEGMREKVKVPEVKILPDAFHDHMKASRKEFLMAFRSLFDAAIDRFDQPKATTKSRTTKIKAE
jgi:hypothetical protein